MTDIVTSEMCDRVVVTPEPEPGGELQLETETGGGETSQYTVIDDIGVTQQSQSEILPEISFDAYGSLFVRDPGFSDQRGAVLSHTRERQGLSTCTVPITGDIMFREEASSSPVSQQQPVVLQPTLCDRDRREAETVTPGPVSGAGPEESDTPHDTDSVSSSDEQRGNVTLTPPRHKPFVVDPQRQVYLTGLNKSTQEAYAEITGDVTAPDDGDNKEDEEVLVTIEVSEPNTDDNDNDEPTKGRKPRGPNKKLLKKQEVQARKEEKKRRYNQAIQAYKDNKFDNIHACAKHYGVDHKSLKRMILGDREYVGGGKSSKILRPEEEAKLVAHLSWCKKVGFGLTYHTLRSLIQELLEAVVR